MSASHPLSHSETVDDQDPVFDHDHDHDPRAKHDDTAQSGLIAASPVQKTALPLSDDAHGYRQSATSLAHDQEQPISVWHDNSSLPEVAGPSDYRNSNGYDPDYAKEVVFPAEHGNASELSASARADENKAVPDIYSEPDEKVLAEQHQPKRRRRICGLPLAILICLVVAAVVVLAVGLGVGLHFGLKKNNSNSSSSGSDSGSGSESGAGSSSSQSSFYSTTGAFNGSGWGFGQAGTNVNDPNGQTQLFFQHHSGQIRWLQQDAAGKWSGGNTAIASDAKNATPMGLLTYTSATVPTWYLYYIDNTNKIRQKIRDSTSTTWNEGPLSALKLTAMDDPFARLRVTYTGNPGPSHPAGTWGMQAFYTTDANTVSQVAWTSDTQQWTPADGFSANARGGIGSITWFANSSIQYAAYVDWNDNVRILWRDVDTTKTSTPQHPVNQWVNSSISIPDVLPTTDLSYTDYLVLQKKDNTVVFYNATFDAENSKLQDQIFALTEDDTPIKSSKLWLSNLPIMSNDPQFTLLYQRNGSDITYLIRDYVTDEMAITGLPVPT